MSLSLNRQIRVPAQQKSDRHLSVSFPSFHTSLLYQITANFIFLKCHLLTSSFLSTCAALQIHPVLLPALHFLCITSFFLRLPLLLSNYLFVGCNLRHVLLCCSQVLAPFVSRPEQGKPSPPLSHWVSPFPLHPDCPKYLLYLCHTSTHNMLIVTHNAD